MAARVRWTLAVLGIILFLVGSSGVVFGIWALSELGDLGLVDSPDPYSFPDHPTPSGARTIVWISALIAAGGAWIALRGSRAH